MKKNIESGNTDTNAQDGQAVLLSTQTSDPVLSVLNEAKGDWKMTGDDSTAQQEFYRREFGGLRRSLLRCGFLVHKMDSLQLYKSFEFDSTADYFWAIFRIDKPVVSRLRTAYLYALRIAEAVPEVTVDALNEAQMRQLRSVVKRLNPGLKKEDQVAKAVQVYEEIHQKTPFPCSADIKKFPEGRLAENEGDSAPTVQPDANRQEAEDVLDDGSEDFHELNPEPVLSVSLAETEEDSMEPLELNLRTSADDRFGSILTQELTDLLGHLLDHVLIDDEIKERLELAFEQLGIVPPGHSGGEDTHDV